MDVNFIRSWLVGGLLALALGCATPPPPAPVEPVAEPESFPPPRVMILMTAKGPGLISAKAAETLLINKLMKAGMTVVDASTVQANQKKIKSFLDSSGDLAGAARIGMELGADVVLRVDAHSRLLASKIASSRLEAYQGEATLEAIHADDGELLATANQSSSVMALDEITGSAKAINTATALAFDFLLPDLQQEWIVHMAEHETRKTRQTLSLAAATGGSGEEAEAIPPAPTGYEAPLAALWRLTPGEGVPDAWMEPATEKLSAGILHSGWFRLVTREDMKKILAEHSVQMSAACESTEQAVEYGKILSTQHIIIGSTTRLGQTLQVVLKIVNVESGEIERAGQAEGQGGPDVLLRLIQTAAARLLTPAGGATDVP